MADTGYSRGTDRAPGVVASVFRGDTRHGIGGCSGRSETVVSDVLSGDHRRHLETKSGKNNELTSQSACR